MDNLNLGNTNLVQIGAGVAQRRALTLVKSVEDDETYKKYLKYNPTFI